MGRSTLTRQSGTRQRELFPEDETRTFIGSSLPSPFVELLLFPPEDLHVDLVVETLDIGFGDSLRDVRGVHTPACRALAAVLAQEFESCDVFLNLSRLLDGELSDDDEEKLFQRIFLVKFSALSDGAGDLVVCGTQSSSQGFDRGDWWRLFRHSEVEPTFFTVRLMEKDGRVGFGHSQMRGLLNCAKQVLNGELRKHEEEQRSVLEKAFFNRGEEHAWAETLALMSLMEEDATAVAPA